VKRLATMKRGATDVTDATDKSESLRNKDGSIRQVPEFLLTAHPVSTRGQSGHQEHPE